MSQVRQTVTMPVGSANAVPRAADTSCGRRDRGRYIRLYEALPSWPGRLGVTLKLVPLLTPSALPRLFERSELSADGIAANGCRLGDSSPQHKLLPKCFRFKCVATLAKANEWLQTLKFTDQQ